MSTRHIILGLLASKPMTGYDIKSLFRGLSWLIEVPSYGSLYPTLHELLEEGLVTVRVEPGQGKPPRKLYQVTEAGQQALKKWFATPEITELSVKAFARQLILADCFSPAELAKYLEQRRTQLASYVERTASSAKNPGSDNGRLGHWLIHDYGAMIARAELTWLEARLAELLTKIQQPAQP